MKDLEKYELAKKRLGSFVVSIVSSAPNAPYSEHVKTRLHDISRRWQSLCRDLGKSYKKVEETVFSLQLFEAMLTRLNSWLEGIEKRVHEFLLQPDEAGNERQRILDLKVSRIFCFNSFVNSYFVFIPCHLLSSFVLAIWINLLFVSKNRNHCSCLLR